MPRFHMINSLKKRTVARDLIINETKLTLTKNLDPSWIAAYSQNSIEVNLTLQNSDDNSLIEINITDEIPSVFTQPVDAALIFVNQSGLNEKNLTTLVTINITDTYVAVNSSNISLAIGDYLNKNDRLWP